MKTKKLITILENGDFNKGVFIHPGLYLKINKENKLEIWGRNIDESGTIDRGLTPYTEKDVIPLYIQEMEIINNKFPKK